MSSPNTNDDLGILTREYASGFRRIGMIANTAIPVTQGDWNQLLSPAVNSYAYTPPTGIKNRVLHARGTEEVSWSLGGELTLTSAPVILGFLSPLTRGVYFPVGIQQNTPGSYLASCLYDSLSINADGEGLISWSMTGKSLTYPTATLNISQSFAPQAVPGWSSGAYDIQSWTLTHNVPLTPNYWNTPSALPR